MFFDRFIPRTMFAYSLVLNCVAQRILIVKMTKNRYYLDTQIWIDYYTQRGPDGIYGDQALKLILKIIIDDSKVIFSNLHEKEMKNIGLSQTDINSLLLIIKPDHVKRVSVTKLHIKEAHKLSKLRNVPLGDAIHAVLARDFEAQLVSRDEKDFRKLKDITKFIQPKNLI